MKNNVNPEKNPKQKKTNQRKTLSAQTQNHEEPNIDSSQKNCDRTSIGLYKTPVIKQTTFHIGSSLLKLSNEWY